MSDYNSSLPVRTQNDGDVVVKIGDGTLPSQQLAVDASGRITIKLNDGAGNSISSTGGSLDVNVTNTVTVSATDFDIRDLSAAQDNVAISDGTDTLEVNADGSINAVVSATDLDIRDLAFATDKVDVSGSTVVVTATDLDIRNLSHTQDSVKVGDGVDFLAVNADGSINSVVTATNLDIRDLTAATDSVSAWLKDEAGNPFSDTNPLPVSISADGAGTEVNNYNTAAAVAAGASSNHDYTVTALKTLLLKQIESSASGKAKIEVQVETGVATGVFTTRFVQFNSTAETNMSIHIEAAISVAAGVRVRVIRTNRDNQSQDLYSTISGFEV